MQNNPNSGLIHLASSIILARNIKMANNGSKPYAIYQDPKGSARPSNASAGRIKSLGSKSVNLGPSKGQQLGSPAPRNPYK